MLRLSVQSSVGALKAIAEPTRLRLLVLLASGELSVKDLTLILGQSQPRISRHLKLLAEAGLVERFREGSWAYFHVSDRSAGGRLALDILGLVDGADRVIARDRERADALKREREAAAHAYFQSHAADWDRIRALHVAEHDVEQAIVEARVTDANNRTLSHVGALVAFKEDGFQVLRWYDSVFGEDPR